MVEELARKFLRERLKSKEDLKNWLKGYLDVDLADCKVSRFATATPLDMVWDIYQLCASEDNVRPKDLRYIAGRSSQKTLSLATLQVLLPLHFKRSVVHFGGTMAQAQRAYAYFNQFVNMPYIKEYLSSPPTQRKTVFSIDGQEVTVEILSITPASVQGAHAPIVSLDELASLAPDKVRAYADIRGVPTYTIDGRPWYKFGISSRKGAYTVIEKEFEQSKISGILFYFWTVLENTRRCPDIISGTEPYSYYVNISDNQALTEEQYQLISPSEKSKYERVNAYKGCFECPLRVVCAGDLKNQKSTCRTLRPVESVIEEFKLADYDWFISQQMSLTPSLEGLVFPKFKRLTFEKTPNEMYKIFTGTEPPRDLTDMELVQFMLAKGVKSYAGLDYGYTDPTAIVIIFEDGQENIYIMKVFAKVGMDPDQLVDTLRDLHSVYKFDYLFPDTSQPALNTLIRKKRFVKVIDDFDKKGQIQNGIALIRQKLSPSVGESKIYGLKGHCDALVEEFEKYHYSTDSSGKSLDEPADEYNHAIDALRYAAINMWKKGMVGMGIIPIDNNDNTKNKVSEGQDPMQAVFNDWMQNKLSDAKINNNQLTTKKRKGIVWEI